MRWTKKTRYGRKSLLSLDPQLLFGADPVQAVPGALGATINAHGLYNAQQFVLRLSPAVHQKLSELPAGIVSSDKIGFDGAQAFSTYLHETIHWWQHVGSTYGFMRSLSYPTQTHGNSKHLKKLIAEIGFKKSIRELAARLPGPGQIGTLGSLANTIVNNHFDFDAFRGLTFNQAAARSAISDPYFECVGHTFTMTYANIHGGGFGGFHGGGFHGGFHGEHRCAGGDSRSGFSPPTTPKGVGGTVRRASAEQRGRILLWVADRAVSLRGA